ncbi:MAG: hypothetical protein A3G45_00190 [Candidatus Staskawiczbacteria bacterium RIFCSPLOWO2_12_FULL_37_15]|uniref:Nucleotidyltransferase n=1 Tax=Candidatus Staskawiczbacteria bacterium RIFCSPLOWO2_12_FULL_37_15 TaxID=1802218 RepID=A0A1G2IRA1_9BACT|nr:MAG: Nucleotidyltransferase substrate binding protein, HI0074 family [Parcubacteria group bacterium GW2011_GWA2_37_10]OGZ76688.1 MAG: hypothetical protein A3G45_00190 [Candidatus Staskawiczbacteria bacterium RIFCSPLOWO2_12_FULL_37_15]HLD38203.1 HI0074 family nucleotidyltransferase substrate-binding subunit [Candidatus Nanoarchaeia archaeon]
MTKTESIKEQYFKTVKNLEETLGKEKTDERRDSAIKRFELCFDVAWKLIKEYLEENKGIICASPNECFREAYRQKIIDYSEFWLQITKERNAAVHTYKEKLAESLYQKLPEILKHFKYLEEKMK